MPGAEAGFDGDFYFHLDCLESFGEADCEDALCLYFTSNFEVASPPCQKFHTSKMGVRQSGRLELFTLWGILEVTRISKKSFRSTAYSSYIANLPFAENCLEWISHWIN